MKRYDQPKTELVGLVVERPNGESVVIIRECKAPKGEARYQNEYWVVPIEPESNRAPKLRTEYIDHNSVDEALRRQRVKLLPSFGPQDSLFGPANAVGQE